MLPQILLNNMNGAEDNYKGLPLKVEDIFTAKVRIKQAQKGKYCENKR